MLHLCKGSLCTFPSEGKPLNGVIPLWFSEKRTLVALAPFEALACRIDALFSGVLEGGRLLEKAAANITVVRGTLSAARAQVCTHILMPELQRYSQPEGQASSSAEADFSIFILSVFCLQMV